MMRDTIFFDLDGTLLPLDMDAFMQQFMGMISALKYHDITGGDVDEAVLHQGFQYMMSDAHPHKSNQAAFLDFMQKKANASTEEMVALFMDFYGKPFDTLKVYTQCEPMSAEVVSVLKAKGYRLVLATNPVFPRIATEKRIAWAGLDIADFVHITTYENANFTKPNLAYYRQILDELQLSAEQCYMVGNSVREDLCAVTLGFEAFLLTDYLIGETSEAPVCKKGNYSDLKKWADDLPPV